MPIRRGEYGEDGQSDFQADRRGRGSNSKRGRSNSDEIEIQKRRGRGSNSKRRKSESKSIAEEEEEDSEGSGGGGGRRFASVFVDDEAVEDEDEEEEEVDEGELDGFIVDEPNDLLDEPNDELDQHGGGGGGGRRMAFVQEEEEEEDIDEYAKRLVARFSAVHMQEYDDETEVGQQALIPCVKDPKLWLVKCAIGREKEVAACLMQKYIDKPGEVQIFSAVAVDHLESYIYVEAYREAHVREACKGLRYVIPQKIMLVPIKEMTNVLSGESKATLSKGSWVRIKKSSEYGGDLARVVQVNNKTMKVRVKLLPRIDLQALGKQLGGEEAGKKTKFVPPPVPPELLMNLARRLGWPVISKRDREIGDYTTIDGVSGMFKDGFLLKWFSRKSVSSDNVAPTLQELENFQELDGDHEFPNRKKCDKFMKGDVVVVREGDLRNLVGRVHIVEEETVHIRSEMKGLPETVAIHQKALQKCFKEGQHVKVVSGSQQGTTGMVVKVDQQNRLITILSDATKEAICVFSDHAVESPEVNNGDRMGNSHCSKFDHHKTPSQIPRFSQGGREHDGRDGFGKGSRVKFRLGPYKGCRGRVVDVKGSNLRVELESQMKTVVVDRLHCISDTGNVAAAVTTPYRSSGCETPMPYMRTPMRDAVATSMPHMMTPMRDPGATPMPYMMTPMRDPRGTPIHGGIRTPLY